MAGRLDNFERWSAEITLGAADATKTLLAAKAGRKAVCTHIVAHVLIAFAQPVDIACGGVNFCRIAASEAAGSESFFGPADFGLVGGAVNTAIIITPGGVGPSVHARAEGYYL